MIGEYNGDPPMLDEWGDDPYIEERIAEQARIDRLDLHKSGCECPERHLMIHLFSCESRKRYPEIADDDAWARLHRGSGGA